MLLDMLALPLPSPLPEASLVDATCEALPVAPAELPSPLADMLPPPVTVAEGVARQPYQDERDVTTQQVKVSILWASGRAGLPR